MATVLEVNVLSPTGGTVAQAGTTFTVTWFSTGATGQRVLYSIDGGNSFTPIVTGLDGSVRSYDWAIPASLVPAGQASIGAIVRVGVKNDSGASTTNDSPPFTIQSAATTAPAPSIAGASPSSGPAAGGTSITINGQNFKTGLKATLGGVALQISNVTARQITAVTPAESAGAAALSVTNPDGQSATLASAFTFVAPSSGTRTIALQLTDPDPTPDGIQPALASGTSITVNIAAGQTKRIGFTVSVTDANNNPVQETLKIKVSGPMPNGLTLDYPTRVTSCGPGQSGGCGSGTLTIATTLDTPYDTYQFTLDASCVDGMCMPSSASLTLVVKQPRVILSLPDPTNMTARVPAGGTATFPIQISREFYFGSILVQPTNDLPRTATTQPIKIDALPTTAKPNAVYQAQFQVATMATSPSMDGTVPGKYDLTLGTIADPRAKTNQLPLKLVVLPQTPSVSVILSPKSQMGQPGKAARYTVDVYRYNFFGKVDIQLPTELPSGTTFALTPGTPTPISVGGVMVGDLTANLLDITLPAGAQPKAYEFHVGATYKPTNAPSTTVQDSAVLDTSAATPTIDLVITQADTKVGQGGLASIEFEVTRSPMTDANVHLDLGMLAGHTMPVSDVQLDAKMTMGRFDVQLDNDAPLGSYMLTLTATANGEQDQKTTPLQVTALQYVVRLTTNIFGSTKSVKQVMPGDPVVFDVDISRDAPAYPGNLTPVVTGDTPNNLMMLPDPVAPTDAKYQVFTRSAPPGDHKYLFTATVVASNGDPITVIPANGVSLELDVMTAPQPMVDLTATSPPPGAPGQPVTIEIMIARKNYPAGLLTLKVVDLGGLTLAPGTQPVFSPESDPNAPVSTATLTLTPALATARTEPYHIEIGADVPVQQPPIRVFDATADVTVEQTPRRPPPVVRPPLPLPRGPVGPRLGGPLKGGLPET